MASSIFRRFPSGDLEIDFPEWEGVNMDGQAFVQFAAGTNAHIFMGEFWEAETGGLGQLVNGCLVNGGALHGRLTGV